MLEVAESPHYLLPGWETAVIQEGEGERATESPLYMPEVAQPIAGNPAGKNLLSMLQFTADDIDVYMDEAYAARRLIQGPNRGATVLPFVTMVALMRQPSTRTGGSMAKAIQRLGGSAQLISGMDSSSEAKGESRADSDIALATQADILGIRTAESYGPAFAAQAIAVSKAAGKFSRAVPVINLGDGTVEHPTQTLGDLFIMQDCLGDLSGQTLAIVGDHERYRAFHSLIIGAVALGMHVVLVESPAARVPQALVDLAGSRLTRTTNLDQAMSAADVLYMGRNPGEYVGESEFERARSRELQAAFARWVVDHERLQQMSEDAILLHPRPRLSELHPSVDTDPRVKDVEQMEAMIPMRMAILALHMGVSIMDAPYSLN